jgi:hypothetical protein
MKRLTNILIALFLSFNLFAFDGNGSATSPYLLKNASDLNQLAVDVNSKGNNYTGKNFELKNHIDLASIKNWKPIGIDLKRSFKGTFDGKGFQILNLTISGKADCMGLFGYVQDAEIRNINIAGTIRGKSRIAGIVANAVNSSIMNCNNAANITAYDKFAGGVVALAIKSRIIDCTNSGVVIAKSDYDSVIGLGYDPEDVFTLPENKDGIYRLKPKYLNIPFLYIPSTINGFVVKRIYNDAFMDNQNIQEIFVSEGVLHFSANIFNGCANLRTINFPTTLLTIGNNAFQGCVLLSGSVVLPPCFNGWGGHSFDDTAIEEITVQSNVQIPAAFYGASKLKKIILSGSSINPLVTNQTTFSDVSSDFQIFVPANLVDSYKRATNWRNYADMIIAIP